MFSNANRLFVLLFNAVNNDAAKDAFDKYYMVTIGIKDLNVLIHSLDPLLRKWGYQICFVGEGSGDIFA